MSLATSQSTEFGTLQTAMDVILESGTLQDLCRRVVHSNIFGPSARGAYVYTLNSRSNLVESAGYGEPYAQGLNEISAWDENPASSAVRTKKLTFQPGNASAERFGAAAFPIMSGMSPVGVFVTVLSPDTTVNTIPVGISGLLEKLIGFFVISKAGALGSHNSKVGSGSVEDLTTRQVTILQFMGDGMTNAEISTKVLLSESTVRQESIRIYRALQVSSRQEAVAKARAIGLISAVKFGS